MSGGMRSTGWLRPDVVERLRAWWGGARVRIMKLTALAAVAVLALAGCGSSAPVAKVAPATTPTTNVSDIAFLAAVRPSIQGSSDAAIIQLGHDACASMDGGKTINDVASDFHSKGFTTDAAAAVPVYAITAYCPQHEDLKTP